ncbi:MAG: YidC/Oxa1 family insertase periplasmic-domain containing protein [Acidobacteriota bacterium]
MAPPFITDRENVQGQLRQTARTHHPRALQPINGKTIPAPFALHFKQAPSNDPNDKLYKVTRSEDGLGVTFEYSDGRLSAKKTFQFSQDSYLVKVTSQVIENGVMLPHSWFGAADSETSPAPIPRRKLGRSITTPPIPAWRKESGRRQRRSSLGQRQLRFRGLEDKYFAGVGCRPAADRWN